MFSCSTRSAKHLILLAPICALSVTLSAPAALAQKLTLADALTKAIESDPGAAVNVARADAAGAAIAEARARPADAVGVDIEDFVGTGPYSSAVRAQATAWYERTWERGGKRAARVAAARSDLGVTTERNRLRRLDMLEQVQTAWVETLAAEAAIPIAEQRLAAAERVYGEMGRRVARGLEPSFAAERAKTAVSEVAIALDGAREQARRARAGLASWWGRSADFDLETASFFSTDSVAPPASGSPDLALLAAERDAAEARVRLAETGNAGDASTQVGIRHFRDGNDVAVMIGGSIPLGTRTANRGNVARAAAESRAAEAEMAVARLQTMREIDGLVAERTALVSEIGRMEREVLPGAERTVALAGDGVARGAPAITFLEVNEAQQALLDALSRRIDLLRRFHLAGVRLDRLAGRHAALLSATPDRQ